LLEIAGVGLSLHKRYGVYLDVVGIATVPENYAEQLTEISGGEFQNIQFFALDSYDTVLAKIEQNIQRDRNDVKHLARVVPFDLEILKDRDEKELRVGLDPTTLQRDRAKFFVSDFA
jgi:hypothetical protein